MLFDFDFFWLLSCSFVFKSMLFDFDFFGLLSCSLVDELEDLSQLSELDDFFFYYFCLDFDLELESCFLFDLDLDLEFCFRLGLDLDLEYRFLLSLEKLLRLCSTDLGLGLGLRLGLRRGVGNLRSLPDLLFLYLYRSLLFDRLTYLRAGLY